MSKANIKYQVVVNHNWSHLGATSRIVWHFLPIHQTIEDAEQARGVMLASGTAKSEEIAIACTLV